jgi:hypothetical protein
LAVLALGLLAQGCSSPPASEAPAWGGAPAARPAPTPSHASGVSASQGYEDLEKYSGQSVTLEGTLYHDRAIHGIVQLDSGLRIHIPHFDQFMTGVDWFKYVGHRCWATGILHTWTKNLDGYHHATLEIRNFSGTTSE